MAIPSGPIKVVSGLDWKDITQYDAFIEEAADPVGWPIERVRGHIVIESRGNPNAHQVNRSNGDSYGLLQVVPFGIGWEGWYKLVRQLTGKETYSRDEIINALYNPRMNILVGVAILEEFYKQYGTLDKASSAFFTGTPNWGGNDTVNGTTGRQYRDTLNALIREQEAFTPVDPIAVIMGRQQFNDSYGFKSPAAGPFYDYFNGHGGHGGQHTGIDVGGNRGDPLYTPVAGVVTCAGTNVGPGSWNTGCAAFRDEDGGGDGRIEIMTDDDVSLILGHCARSVFSAGQRVQVGQKVATMGGMRGSHVHIETRKWRQDGRCS